jgi:4-hydroxy-2-oxoglutarate aldolase
MKDSSPEGPVKLLSRLDPEEDFHILAGSANFFYPSLHVGAPGGVISLTNALPDPCCELYRLFVQGEYDRARVLHSKLARLNQAVSGNWGVPGVKAAMNLTGFKGGQPRHPLKPVSDEAVEEIRRRITSEGFMKA